LQCLPWFLYPWRCSTKSYCVFPQTNTLTKVCQVSRLLREIANPILYSDLDLRVDVRATDGTKSRITLWQKKAIETVAGYVVTQLRLVLLTILTNLSNGNPTLGSLVQTFHNNIEDDATDGTDKILEPDILVNAAKNMISLRSATLKSNPLTKQIWHSLESYRHLSDLSLHIHDPQEYSWPKGDTALTKLTWTTPECTEFSEENNGDMTASYTFVQLKIMQASCPLLRSLDLVYTSMREIGEGTHFRNWLPYPHGDLPEQHTLHHLHHFGIRGPGLGPFDLGVRIHLQRFLKSCSNSLTSLTIASDWITKSEVDIEYFLSLCESLPNLKTLELAEGGSLNNPDIDNLFPLPLAEFVEKLAARKSAIESFTLFHTGSSFSRSVGQIFSSWSGLKRLRLSLMDNNAITRTSLSL
jgi:hypothetical protein